MQPQVAQPGTDVAQAPTGEHTLSPVVGEVVEQELNSLSGTFHEALLSYKEIIADLRSSRYF